jgi:hypothetical protein
MFDPLHAITHRNLEDLTSVLRGGWVPPRILARSQTTPNHAAWTEVILRDWVEGLRVLDQYFPDITRQSMLLTTALRNGSTQCAMFLWDALGLTAATLLEEQKQSVLDSLSLAMGEPWSPSYEVRDILPLLAFFKDKQVSLDGVMSGEFEPGDFRSAGHSLFTRAVSTRRWDVVRATFPDPQSPLPSWPRLDEVLLNVLEVVAGDYRPLMVSSFVHARSGAGTRAFVDMEFMPGVFQQAGIADDRFIVQWLSSFHSQWPQANEEVVNALAQPTRTRISAWLRLPFLLEGFMSGVAPVEGDESVSVAPDQLRIPLWNAWSRVLGQDPTQAWLRALAQDPADPDVQALMVLMQREAPALLGQHWTAPGQDGLSPSQIWEMNGGVALQ